MQHLVKGAKSQFQIVLNCSKKYIVFKKNREHLQWTSFPLQFTMRYLINNVVLKCRSFNPSKLHLQKIDDPSTNQVDITQSRELCWLCTCTNGTCVLLTLPETGPQVCSLDLYRSQTLTLICGQIKLRSHCFESCGIHNNVDDFKIFWISNCDIFDAC